MAGRNDRVTGKGEYNAYCQSCMRKFKASQLRRRPEDNLWVCDDDWESTHPQKFVRAVADNVALPFVLNNDEVDAGVDITGEDIRTVSAANTNQTPLSIVHYSEEIFNAATANFSVDKAYVGRPVTLPDGITLTVNHSIVVRGADGVEDTFTAGDYTGSSETDW